MKVTIGLYAFHLTRRADRTVSWNSDSVFRHPTDMLLLTGEKVENVIVFPPYVLI
jgi:hypothetical protein